MQMYAWSVPPYTRSLRVTPLHSPYTALPLAVPFRFRFLFLLPPFLLRLERLPPLLCRTSFVYLDHLCAVPLFFFFYIYTGLSGRWLAVSGVVVCWSLLAHPLSCFVCILCAEFRCLCPVSLSVTHRLGFGLLISTTKIPPEGKQRRNLSEK